MATTPVGREQRAGELPAERAHARPDDAHLARWIEALGPEPAQCLICAAAAPRRLFFRDQKWFWICAACELVWVHDVYPEYVREVAYLDDPERYADRREPGRREGREIARALRQLASYRRSGRLLEVGCGPGVFLGEALRAGWQATGIEIQERVAAALRAERGFDVRAGELHDAGFSDGEFDAAYLNEVIEHVVDPLALFREIARVLRPGGAVLVRTGNARSWSARLRGKDWQYYHFGGHDHIRYYSPRAMEALARACGLCLVACHTRGFAFREKRELRGRWHKPLVQLGQALISPLAGPCGAGHRMSALLARLTPPAVVDPHPAP